LEREGKEESDGVFEKWRLRWAGDRAREGGSIMLGEMRIWVWFVLVVGEGRECRCVCVCVCVRARVCVRVCVTVPACMSERGKW